MANRLALDDKDAIERGRQTAVGAWQRLLFEVLKFNSLQLGALRYVSFLGRMPARVVPEWRVSAPLPVCEAERPIAKHP